MASTYDNNLRLNEMGTGDQSGTWGSVTNTNLEFIYAVLEANRKSQYNYDQHQIQCHRRKHLYFTFPQLLSHTLTC